MKKLFKMKDLMGQAIWDFYHHKKAEDVLTETSISEIDEPVSYTHLDVYKRQLKYSNTQELKYSRTQILKYSNTQILKYSNTQELKYPGT